MANARSKIAIFVDGENLRYMGKQLGITFDIKGLLGVINTNLAGEFYYGAYVVIDRSSTINNEDSGLIKSNPPGRNGSVEKYQNVLTGYKRFLANVGFRIISKHVKRIQTADALKNKSGGDIELCVEMMSFISTHANAKKKPKIVLISGDSDFEYLLKRTIDLGFEAWVAATCDCLSSELIAVVGGNRIIYLDSCRDLIKMPEK